MVKPRPVISRNFSQKVFIVFINAENFLLHMVKYQHC